jgi:prophage regulatory protein
MKVLRLRGVLDRTGLSRTTIWRLEEAGTFPRRRKLSAGAVGWMEEEIDRWLHERVAVQTRSTSHE